MDRMFEHRIAENLAFYLSVTFADNRNVFYIHGWSEKGNYPFGARLFPA